MIKHANDCTYEELAILDKKLAEAYPNDTISRRILLMQQGKAKLIVDGNYYKLYIETDPLNV